jgi:hypothetical protein
VCVGGLEQNLLHPFSPEAHRSPPPKQEKEKRKSRFTELLNYVPVGIAALSLKKCISQYFSTGNDLLGFIDMCSHHCFRNAILKFFLIFVLISTV